MEIRKATALVTGANRGIGRALTAALLAAGVGKVYATARNPDGLDHPAGPDDDRVVRLRADVTDRAAVTALAKSAADVTLLINNAGILSFGSILDTPLDAVEAQFGTNFYAPLNISRAFAPLIERNGGGAIVNILTIVALASMPGLAGYNASKAAAWSMTQSLRGSLAGKGITVHAVFPGPVDTDMAAGIDIPKTSAADVATAIIRGLEAGIEDIFPDAMSADVYAAWKSDHKAIERRFAAM